MFTKFMKFLFFKVTEVKINNKTSTFCEDYFLLKVKPCHSNYPSLKSSHSEVRKTSAGSSQKDEKRLEGFFLKANQMVKLDPDMIVDFTSLSNHGKPANKSLY